MGCYTSPKRKREGTASLSLALRASVNSQSERTTREKPFGARNVTEELTLDPFGPKSPV